MQAIIQRRFGPGDVLRLEVVPMPVPRDNEVRIRVHAASVSFGDWRLFIGKPYIIRLVGYGVFVPSNRIPGQDIAGVVDAVGKHVESLKPGDLVFGQVHSGGFAEYVNCKPNQITRMPSKATFEQAAAVPTSGFAALQAVRNHGKLQPGQHVLINGASGGVGTFAVQIAKALGAHVTGVCSGRNVDLVEKLGADVTINYELVDFAKAGSQYDVILDTVGNRSLEEYQRALTSTGIFVAVTGPPGDWLEPITFYQRLAEASKKSTQQFVALLTKPNLVDLEYLRDLMESGTLSPVIDRRYSLQEVPEALAHQGTGHVRGKSIIQVAASA